MDEGSRLDALQQRVSQALRSLPGATALYLFGSRVGQPSDPYADLDLQVLVGDIAAARRCWPHVLEHVAPIRVAWPITAASDNTAFAILFQGESLYHKVDIGLSPEAERAAYAARGGPYQLLWEQETSGGEVWSHSSSAFMPAHGSVGHALMDDLIAAVRYVKARRRQQRLTCWRFIRGKPDLLFRLHAERRRRWEADLPPLSTWEYKALDEAGIDETVEEALGRLTWSTPEMMDASFCWLTDQIARLLAEKAAARHEELPHRLIDEHLAFIAAELGVPVSIGAPVAQ